MVWATLDKSLGRAAIKSFIVPREHPGLTVARLEHKLGIKASDTAVIRFEDARIPKDNILGARKSTWRRVLPGSCRPSTTPARWLPRWPSAVGRAALEELRTILTEAGVEISYDTPANASPPRPPEFLRMEADWEAGYLLSCARLDGGQ